MPLVQYVSTALSLQIEGFPAEVKEEGKEARPFERSVEGSLHLRPGLTLDLTADEYAHIKAKRPEVFSSLRCMMTDEERAASVAAQAPAAEPEQPEESSEGSAEASGNAPRPAKPKRS